MRPSRPAPPDLRSARWLWLAAVLAVLLGLVAGAVPAQQASPVRTAAWDALGTRADAAIASPNAETALLDSLRASLVAARSEALAAQQALQPEINSLQARLDALGRAPGEGVTEPEDIAARRASLTQALADARAPVLEAQEAYRRAGIQIGEIDRILVSRATAALLTRGPSPLWPATWIDAVSETTEAAVGQISRVAAALSDAGTTDRILSRLPLRALMILLGIALAFTVRARVGQWVERELTGEVDPRRVAWIVALRNLNRLLLPAVGAGLLFAALDPSVLAGLRPRSMYFRLPEFVWVLIGAGWLGGSLFAPRSAAHRIVLLSDAEARQGSSLVLILGGLMAANSLLEIAVEAWGLTRGAQAALFFPLLLASAAGLWRAARLIALIRERLVERRAAGTADDIQTRLPDQVARLGGRLVSLASLAVVGLAAAGYLEAAQFLAFRTMLTLGLVGAGNVVYDVLSKTLLSLPSRRRAEVGTSETGLLPVAIGAVVVIACIPLLAMVWGADVGDILEAWDLLQAGVSVGGMRLSLGVIVRFAVAFAIAFALTRLLQAVLRAYVLPRTRLDTGGRNAILAGLGYTGFAVAVLIGVSAAGLDLSSLAIVAGALSVGIGFGLQTIVSNFVSGIILLVERPIKEGDWIEVGGFSGYVRGINVRSTEIETFDRASVIVPNQDLIAGTVLNRTHIGMSGRLIVPVRVAFDSDPRHVERVLTEIAEENPLVLADPAPAILFIGVGPDAMNFEIRCRLRDVNYMLTVHSDMNFEIVARFRSEGISIPFPQREVHVRGPSEREPRASDGDTRC